MDNIIEPSIDFDFSKLYLSSPSPINGGAYFTRFVLQSKPVYIQTPKCLTRQGFVKSGKKIYTDLMFDHNDSVFIQWLENLETKCQELILEKSDKWFESKLDSLDIESAFTSPIRIFKSGKYYLLRVHVKPNVKVYNEVDAIVSLDDVKPDMNIISILEVQGIKFTSRNFQIEIELKQSMIVSPDPFLDECFIKKPLSNNRVKPIDSTPVRNVEKDLADSKMEPTLEEQEVNLEEKEQETTLEEEVNLEKQEVDLQEQYVNLEEEMFSSNDLTEVDISPATDQMESITLTKPNQVYYNLYKSAREKAKQAKQEAILAFLEAKNIKKTYMLDDIEESDGDSDIDSNVESEYDEEFMEDL